MAPRPWKRWSPWTAATCCLPRDARPSPAWTVWLAVCEDRDGFELELARLAHERSLPTLGICRGMQVMNVALGGSLYRDLYNCGVTEKQHRQNPPYYGISHKVTIAKGSLLESVVSASGDFEVNSMHHQGVDHVAPALLVAARSEDRVVEAVEDPAKPFFLGVQWHPEYLDRPPRACSTPWPPQPTTATHGAHNLLPAKTFLFLVTKSSSGFLEHRFTLIFTAFKRLNDTVINVIQLIRRCRAPY